MGNCICGTLSCLSATIVAVIRAILFVSCVLLTLSSAISLWALYMIETNVTDLNFPGVSVTFRTYVFEAILLVVSIMGAHGAFSKNPKYLKLFALFIALYAVVHFFMVADELSGTDWAKNQKEFQKLMTDYAKSYQWDVPAGQEPNKGTRAWDLVQSRLLCCGLDGPNDWTKGPLHKGGDQLPRSCCFNLPRAFDNNGKCNAQSMDLFAEGCSERIEYIIAKAFAHVVFKSFVYVLLGIFALILASQGRAVATAVVYSSPSGGPVYERFSGSVYVRANPGPSPVPAQRNIYKQPPVAPGNSLYPSMDLPPPPRYTSS